MRWLAILALSACAHQPQRVLTCGGRTVVLPPQLRIVRATATDTIAASRDVAVAVLHVATPAPRPPSVVDVIDGSLATVYTLGFRDGPSCAWRAVAIAPLSPDGAAVLTAIADTSEPSVIVGGALVQAGQPPPPRPLALTVLLRAIEP